MLAEARRHRGYGLFGMSKYSSSIHPKELVKRVLYTMLCEDAYLHAASNIVILWPYAISAEQRPERVRLGRHQYKVEIISRPKGKKSSDVVVGFAIIVSLSLHTERDF